MYEPVSCRMQKPPPPPPPDRSGRLSPSSFSPLVAPFKTAILVFGSFCPPGFFYILTNIPSTISGQLYTIWIFCCVERRFGRYRKKKRPEKTDDERFSSFGFSRFLYTRLTLVRCRFSRSSLYRLFSFCFFLRVVSKMKVHTQRGSTLFFLIGEILFPIC